MKKRVLVYLFLIALILLLVVNAVSAANETEDMVMSNASDALSITPSGNTFASIQKSVDSAKNGDTIELKGTYNGSGKSIKVSKSLTFQGSDNATLDAQYLSGIVSQDSKKKLVFKNITFINSNDYGISRTGSEVEGIKLEIYNCTFKNIRGEESYAVDASSIGVTIENSKFIDNDNAIRSYTDYPENVVSITNSVFDNNYYSALRSSYANIINCDFTNNGNLEEYGRGIYFLNGKIKNCRFINNSAANDGGAIKVEDFGSLTADNCRFINNYARYMGGAILASENLNITNCEFIGNNASNGAAIFSSYSETFHICNTTFVNNTAEYGTIYSASESAFINCHFKNNSQAAIISSKITLTNCNSITKTIDHTAILDDELVEFDLVEIVTGNVETTYKSGEKLEVQLINTKTGKPIDDFDVQIIFKSDENSKNEHLTTNSQGMFEIDVSDLEVGTYNVTFNSYEFQYTCPLPATNTTVIIHEMERVMVNVFFSDVETTYKSGEKLEVQLLNNETGKPIDDLEVKITFKSGKVKQYERLFTDSEGKINISLSKLKVGAYEVTFKIYGAEQYMLPATSASVNISKAKTTVKAHKVTAKFRKTKYFRITVKYKTTKKPVKKVKIKVKVFTGKKSKTYWIKTNKKGIARLNTKKLKKGKHKVVIKSANKNYSINAKSTIKIIK